MILYALFRTLESLLMLLPYRMRKAFFTGLASLAFALDGKHRRVVQQNLALAYGGVLDDKEIEVIARYCYRNLMLNFLQVVENHHNDSETMVRDVTFENRDIVERVRAQGRPVIFISGHFCNWELGAAAIASQVMPTVSIHKQLNNPYFDRYLMQSRSRHGMRMAEKRGAIKHLTRALKKGEGVSMMIDQNINPKESIVVDFFGKAVTQTSAPAFLARKFNAAIIPVFIHTDDEKHHIVRFEEEIETPKTQDNTTDMLLSTQLQSDLMERIVRAEPKYWFWCHRRWKTKHPEIYDARS